MNLHDWSTVGDGAFRHFQMAWIAGLCRALNRGGLPAGYGAHAERTAGSIDAVAAAKPPPDRPTRVRVRTMTGADDARTVTRPAAAARCTVMTEAPDASLARGEDWLVVRDSDRTPVAVVDIVSPARRRARGLFEQTLRRSAEMLQRSAGVTLVDVHRPNAHAPRGTADAVWKSVTGSATQLAGRSAATIYEGYSLKLFAEPLAIGGPLPSVPLFLGRDGFVSLPLAAGYALAWLSMPADEQEEIEVATAATARGADSKQGASAP